jgi:hypothetical protein
LSSSPESGKAWSGLHGRPAEELVGRRVARHTPQQTDAFDAELVERDAEHVIDGAAHAAARIVSMPVTGDLPTPGLTWRFAHGTIDLPNWPEFIILNVRRPIFCDLDS